MRAFIVSCVFPPEPVVSARTSGQIAHALATHGHQITVITPFPNRPAGKLYPGYQRRLFQREQPAPGYQIIRCFNTLSAESKLLSRLLENLSFGLTGAWAALTLPRPDVIYANTWPLFAGGILFAVAKLRGIPLVLSVQDVYPESLLAQQRRGGQSAVVRGLRWLDGLIARGAAAVIVISDRFAAVYRSGRRVAPERLHVIPNWVEPDLISLDPPAEAYRTQKKLPPDAFIVTYGGNIGVAAGVETVIQSFQYLNGARAIHLVVAGEGSQAAACRQLARQTAAGRIIFHSPWPAAETSPVLTAADVLILPTRGDQSLASVPSKLMTYMLAARPVLALALPESDTARLIQQAGCGWVIEPDQPRLLAAKLKEVAALEPAELARLGQAGRDFALQHLTSAACLPRVIEILQQAAR